MDKIYRILLILVISCGCMSLPAAYAKQNKQGKESDGGWGSGGGSYLESVFRIKANDIVRKIKRAPEANSLCSADLLTATLDSVEIRVVENLKDLNTDKSIDQAIYDAWTMNKVIQLRSSVWERLFENPSDLRKGKALNALILHEVLRATQACDDDRFVLSAKMMGFIGGVSLPGKTWEFKELVPLYCDYQSDAKSNLHCDNSMIRNLTQVPSNAYPIRQYGVCASKEVSEENICIYPDAGLDVIHLWRGSFLPAGRDLPGWAVGIGRNILEFNMGGPTNAQQINFFRMVNLTGEGIFPSFLLHYDIETKTLSYGIDAENLIPIVENPKF